MSTAAPLRAPGAVESTPASAPLGVPAVAGIDAQHTLDRSLLSGVAWTAGAKWLSQILAWTSTLIVARLLAPEDYGLMGMATVYLGLVTMLSEFGIGAAVVTLLDLDDHRIAQLNGAAVMLGVAGLAISCAAAIPLGAFFGAPELPAIVMVMSSTFLISAFRSVPYALLQRELRFRPLALMEGSRSLLLAVSMVGFALAGFGYWTLVAGGIVSAVLSTALVLVVRRHGFAWPQWAPLRSAVTYSRHIIIGRLSYYIYSNADFAVAGRVLGKAALGAYGFAWTLAYIPLDKISALVYSVTPAFFSRLQHDPDGVRRYLLVLTEGIALLTFPATLGIALVAGDFVVLVLGDQWREMATPLRLLTIYAAFRSVTPLLPQVLNVLGEARYNMRNNVLAAFVLPPAFYIGAQWGTTGLALAWIVVHPVLMLPLYRRVFALVHLGASDYLKALWPALSGSLLMAGAVVAAGLALPADVTLAFRLAVEVAVGASTYGATILLLHRARLRTFVGIMSRARRAAD